MKYEELKNRLFTYVETNEIHSVESGTEDWLELISYTIDYKGSLDELLDEDLDEETMETIFNELNNLSIDVY